MLKAKVTRSKKAEYQRKMSRIQELFLEEAGALVAGEAKTRTPVNTGRLRNSIEYRVTEDDAIIGTNVEYAPYVEYGTSRMRAQPYLRPALDENRRRINELLKDNIRRVFRGR